MKIRKSSKALKSFEDLKTFLDIQDLSFPDRPVSDPVPCEREFSPELEEALFVKAMEGVAPIERENYVERIFRANPDGGLQRREEEEVLSKLEDLVRYGKGFNISDTPEYVEGTGYHVHPAFAKRLHQGDYSVQAHVDLHGFNVNGAKELFEKFLRGAVLSGKTAVLIVHGRGLSSPSEPVLKKKVVEWLTRGPWRKWVAAYASARRCDGGVGATYVLLRTRPLSKRSKLSGSNRKKRPGVSTP